jgi:hypothetical protein
MNDADYIAELETRRLREHRLIGVAMRDVRQLTAFVQERRIVLLTGKAAIPNMADAIAGRPLRGSWMANPEVHLIYRLTSRLQGFLGAPLILGKSTTVDPALAPALYSLAADPARRQDARGRLSLDAARLLELVAQRGAVRMDAIDLPTKQSRKARVELEREFLVHSYDIHTDRGAHTSVIEEWEMSPLAKELAGTELSSLEHAVDTLVHAGLRSAVLAPEREVRKWFEGASGALDRLVNSGSAQQLRAAKQALVTLA